MSGFWHISSWECQGLGGRGSSCLGLSVLGELCLPHASSEEGVRFGLAFISFVYKVLVSSSVDLLE